MQKIKKMGIWMDHSNAFLMELTDDSMIEKTISSEFNHEGKDSSLKLDQKTLHNKEQQMQSSYYKELINSISNFHEVVLFGPTEAKLELLNLIEADHLLDDIKIEVQTTDKMTAAQMHEFVREHFK